MDCLSKKKTEKILIIEDDSDIVNCYKYLFEDICDTVIVQSASKAIECIRTNDYDLAIMDYRLPDMSGMELLKKIKFLKPSLIIIVVTAFGDEDIAVNIFRQGASDYLRKPFDYNELIDKVKLHLNKLGNIRENYIKGISNKNSLHSTGISLSNPNFYKIQKALHYIDSNYMYKISLDQVADLACMTKYHFSKMFKKFINSTFQDYLTFKRIEKAKQLLAGNYTITDIALNVGYADITHFERIFKRITGCTPSNYKKNQYLFKP